jgi:hypothetical protein
LPSPSLEMLDVRDVRDVVRDVRDVAVAVALALMVFGGAKHRSVNRSPFTERAFGERAPSKGVR